MKLEDVRTLLEMAKDRGIRELMRQIVEEHDAAEERLRNERDALFRKAATTLITETGERPRDYDDDDDEDNPTI